MAAISGSLSGFGREVTIDTGKTLFAQLLDFLPWMHLVRDVARYGEDKGVRVQTCAEWFRVMAFA